MLINVFGKHGYAAKYIYIYIWLEMCLLSGNPHLSGFNDEIQMIYFSEKQSFCLIIPSFITAFGADRDQQYLMWNKFDCNPSRAV